MKSKLITAGVVFLVLAGITTFNMYFEQDPITAAQQREQEAVAKKLEENHAAEHDHDDPNHTHDDAEHGSEAEELQLAAADATAPAEGAPAAAPEATAAPEASATPVSPTQEGSTPETAPDVYKVKFETTKGDVVIEVHKEWAPLGAQRFYDLVRTGFFDDNRFFRVVPDFVVQWGIAGEPKKNDPWENKKLQDDPVKQSNTEGYVTFAAAGRPNTRGTQVFINYGNNANLDGMGFAPFGKVVEGMDVARSFNSMYQERPTSAQGQIRAQGNAWLDKQFPGLDYIKQARIVQ